MVVVVRFIRCAKKLGITKVELYSDEKREWMREYSALGSKVSLASASIL
jgi:acetyl/propionyl-CoA carboxylase alpha subunit